MRTPATPLATSSRARPSPYVVGPPVRAAGDFFGRAGQTRRFYETLASGPQAQCVSVLGLRRAGKTSFLQHVAQPAVMAEHLPDAARYISLFVDLSACRAPADFYARVARGLLRALPGRATAESPAAADAYTVESLLYAFAGRRVILFMDEFDALRVAGFGDDFLTELRALAGVWDYELAYVTASYWPLAQLGNFVGLPPTSPFYNIFFPTPLYVAGLGPAELDALVRVPAGRVGIMADDEDVALVRDIAGTLPFFVQATAAAWLAQKADGRPPDAAAMSRRLTSEMGPYFEQWWRGFSDVERDVLRAVAAERPVARLSYDAAELEAATRRLADYGVLVAAGDQWGCDSALFRRWLAETIQRR